MDVFDADGVYVGTVVHVSRQSAIDRTKSTDPGDAQEDVELSCSGESLGPMPTAALGNGGPRRQSAATTYASEDPTAKSRREPAALVTVRLLVALRPTTLWPVVRRIPVRLIQNASLERIMLSTTERELQRGRP